MILVSYDISSDKVRNRVFKICKNYGQRIQYSVFECNISAKRYRELYGKLIKETAQMQEGSIRFYDICENCMQKIRVIGNTKTSDEKEDDVIVI